MHTLMYAIHNVNGAFSLTRRPERGGGKKVGRPLQPAPRVRSVVAVLGNTSHCQWMKGLHKQRPQSTDEHCCVSMHTSNRAVFAEPSRCGRLHELHHSLLTIGPRNTITECFAQRLSQSAERRINTLTVDRHATIVPSVCASSVTKPFCTLNV
jgi:hypothetical protein